VTPFRVKAPSTNLQRSTRPKVSNGALKFAIYDLRLGKGDIVELLIIYPQRPKTRHWSGPLFEKIRFKRGGAEDAKGRGEKAEL
jgi:hypothetical protein